MLKGMTNIVGIKETNSVDFINLVFEHYNRKIPVVFIKSLDLDSQPLSISKMIQPNEKYGWISFNQQPILDDNPAQIVYTSGTEGKPKSILLNHVTLANTVNRLNKVMNVDKSIREYIGVPVNYSFGFARCRAVAAAGGKAYIPENGFNPIEIKNMLKDGLINAISAVPSLWRILIEKKSFLAGLGEKIKWIEIGSQFMSANEKTEMLKLFPNATIVQHYGLTEASRSTFLVLNKTPTEHLGSVGHIDNVEIKISSDYRIMIRGDNVADGIYINKKIIPVTDKQGWLVTNDLGHIKDNYLYYDGRADDIINCGGIKINPDIVQAELEQSLDIANELVITKYPCPIRGDGFLVVVLKSCNIGKDRILKQLSSVLEKHTIHAASSLLYVQTEEFPRTSTGKIIRNKISHLYENIAPAHPTIEKKLISEGHLNHVLYSEYSNAFPNKKILEKSTFSSLGGDSLSYVQISMVLENQLGFLPKNWENTSIEKLANNVAVKKTFWSELESSIVLRVIAIIAVVLTHADFNYAGGGTILLFVLIGYNMGRFKHNEFVQFGAWNWLKTYSIKILIPYTILAFIFVFYKKEFDLSTIFLVTNLIELKLTHIFPFWFVQVLLQCLLIIGVLFSFSVFRQILAKKPWITAIIVLAFLLAIRTTLPFIWDTDYLRNLVPQRFILLIWLGYCFSFTNTNRQKLFMVVIGAIIAYVDVQLNFKIHWVLWASIILAYLPTIKVPQVSKPLFNAVANATFYIFIFNGIVLSILTKLINLDSRVLMTFLTLIICISIWKIIDVLKIENRAIKIVTKIKRSK